MCTWSLEITDPWPLPVTFSTACVNQCHGVGVCSTTPCRRDATTRRTAIWVCAVYQAAILQNVGALKWRHSRTITWYFGRGEEGKQERNIYVGKNCRGEEEAVREKWGGDTSFYPPTSTHHRAHRLVPCNIFFLISVSSLKLFHFQ